MAFFYLDASAIAKMYLPDEQGVDFVVQLLGSRLSGDVFVTSTLSIVEVKSAIFRRIDSPGDKESLLEAYDRDVQEIFNLGCVDISKLSLIISAISSEARNLESDIAVCTTI